MSDKVQYRILTIAATQCNHKPGSGSTDGYVDQSFTFSRFPPARVTSDRVEQDRTPFAALSTVDRRYGDAGEVKFSKAAFDPPFAGPEDLGLLDRCISRSVPGSMIPVMYGNTYEP